jgi:hypothetical protein
LVIIFLSIFFQFQKLVDGDRYFFTHSGGVGAKFNDAQIRQIRRVSLADVLCKSQSVNQIQRKAFEIQSAANPIQSCSQAFSINLQQFFTGLSVHKF